MTGEEFLKHLKNLGYEVHRAEAQYRSVFRSLTGTTADPSKEPVHTSGGGSSRFAAIAIAAEKWDEAKTAFNTASIKFMELIDELQQEQKDDLTFRYLNRLTPKKVARKLHDGRGVSPAWERAIHIKARAAFNEIYEKRG